MAGVYDRIRRLLSPAAAERGAEDDVIDRMPETARGKAREIQRKRMQDQEEAARIERMKENQAKQGGKGIALT